MIVCLALSKATIGRYALTGNFLCALFLVPGGNDRTLYIPDKESQTRNDVRISIQYLRQPWSGHPRHG